MTREEAKSCICTIKMLQRLAYNIHGVMDVIDADNCKKIIKALEQEPRWIPVSERLPEEMGTYMTTIDYGEYGLATGQRYYHGKGLKWNDECVIAWMPLPQPYKESEGK